jgi:RNA polymerase sigma-70 factor, ECF subfamily
MNRITEQDGEAAAPCDESPQRSDEELLTEYRDHGDREAFAQLVHRYERELYNYLRQYLGDAHMAEDAFQTTFLQVHLKCGTFEPGRRVRPWLYTIATNQAIDAQRRNRRHRMMSLDRHCGGNHEDQLGALVGLLDGGTVDPLERIERMEQAEAVREAVDRLPDALKEALVLVYYQGLKYREAAEALSIPVGTVKSRLHAAVYRLNQALVDMSLANHG